MSLGRRWAPLSPLQGHEKKEEPPLLSDPPDNSSVIGGLDLILEYRSYFLLVDYTVLIKIYNRFFNNSSTTKLNVSLPLVIGKRSQNTVIYKLNIAGILCLSMILVSQTDIVVRPITLLVNLTFRSLQ